ncbi:MAG: metallophosphoesterase [Paenibacillus sp.]|jgi:3',5'-cyclic AMP phosphodiesterase CpdA|nr:metallophosphoesterase [Paenibacillus sp.]
MTFSIVIIPDTQLLSRSHPDKFSGMTQWIAEQQEAFDIRMVLHLGDVVHNGAADEAQFQRAQAALDTIDNAGIPMLIVPGNHDYDNMLSNDRSLAMFNRYFGLQRYADKSWYGGAFEPGHAENMYALLDVQGYKLLFLALEFGPRDEALAWADDVLSRHADYEAIVVTHCYMFMDGTRNKPGDAHNPTIYPACANDNDGESVWHKCLKKHANVIAVYSGHQIPRHTSVRLDQGEHGNPVFQSFQNWQGAPSGGEGRIRVVHFDAEAGRMNHRVYNPHQGCYETLDGYEVACDWKQ